MVLAMGAAPAALAPPPSLPSRAYPEKHVSCPRHKHKLTQTHEFNHSDSVLAIRPGRKHNIVSRSRPILIAFPRKQLMLQSDRWTYKYIPRTLLAYTHTYIHTCMHTYIDTYVHTYTYIQTYIHTHKHTHIHTRTRDIHICTHACICTCTRTCMFSPGEGEGTW